MLYATRKRECNAILMYDEISWLRDQLGRSFTLLPINGLRLELTDSEPRQRLLEVVVKESEDEIASACCQFGGFHPLGQDQHVIIEADVFGTSFECWSAKVTVNVEGILLTDGVRRWVRPELPYSQHQVEESRLV